MNFYLAIGEDFEEFFRQDGEKLKFAFVKNKFRLQTLFHGKVAADLIELNQGLYITSERKSCPTIRKK